MEAEFFYVMPRGQLTKDIIKTEVLKLKKQLQDENVTWTSDPKGLASQYLNKVLDKISEYGY
jgi:hypothetical protein